MKYIFILLVLSNLLLAKPNIKYDIYISKYYNQYYSIYKHIYNYNIIKAQAITESNLNERAISPVGARGLMQIMPATERSLKSKLNITINDAAFNPEYAIFMGIYYDYTLFKQWKANRTIEDKYKLMFASYNAGIGHLLSAQRKCNCNDYNNISAQLPNITGHHSKETLDYVKRIFDNYKNLR